jgi:hypothetical protein
LSRELEGVLKKQDLRGYVDLKAFSSPQRFEKSDAYFASAALLKIFAKSKLPSGIDQEAAAVSRFYEAEKLCRITNKRLLHYRQFDHACRPLVSSDRVHEVFHLARRKIQSWLGPLDKVAVLEGARHGPGGVVGLKRPATTPYYKFAVNGYTCSSGAYWYAVRAIASNDAWIRSIAQELGICQWDCDVSCIPYETKIRLADSCITITEHNEVTFVPKDAFTKRSISIEPEMNIYLQLAVGKHLKKVLRRAGCDLSDQTRNQELAYVGSVQHEVYDPVTLDLRMASDTMSTEIVRELLPCEWFEFLDDLRSVNGSRRAEVLKWQKFSSMGNGFTFELESMIFLALAQSCSDLSGTTQWFTDTFGPAYSYAYVSVFGDDIIVPKKIASHTISILRYAGFQLNLDKSFVEGPFRESCGEDYWMGSDVRPYFFKRGLSHVRDLVHLHNGLKRLNERLCGLEPAMDFVRQLLPDVVERHLRGHIPTEDDCYLWCEPDECMSSALVTWDIHCQTWSFPAMRFVPTEQRGRTHWRYLQFLYVNTRGQLAVSDDGRVTPELEPLEGNGERVIKSGEGSYKLQTYLNNLR